MIKNEYIETVVIGAGQAGLSTGYHLAGMGRPFTIVDAVDRVGDNWRCHWDSLRLYTPAGVSSLPGMRFPLPRSAYPTKDEMADYLEAYAAAFELPVRTGTRVLRVVRDGDGYLVTTEHDSIACDNVVAACGTFGRTPFVPPFADELSTRIRQLHSSDYQRPDQLQDGPALVVGASHSGSDIAFEAASAGHPTILSGPVHGEVPFDLASRKARVIFPIFAVVAKHLLTARSPMGSSLRHGLRHGGGPLLRFKTADLERVGVELVDEKTTGVQDGRPVLGGDRALDVANVVWCTGFRHDFSWIDLPVVGEDGWPLERRGVAESWPGLYFAGLAFQYAFSSMLVGGAGRDARHVARKIAKRSAELGRKTDGRSGPRWATQDV